ncbi:MAG: flagellar filament capping protein FliD [Bdellovibrio sp.]|nr:flagellar filament capping protein FliD [Bdellovibrio sp.]
MPIRISGLASGLPSNLVDQVIEAERIPIKTMQEQKTKIEDKVKLVTDLETKINDITKNLGTIIGPRGFTDRKLNSSFPDVINGTLDADKAEAGEWNVEVLQLAGRPSVVTNGAPDKDKTTMGVGYLKFDTAEGPREVYINEDNSTLDKIAETINNSNVGVKAIVINDRKDKEDNFKLQITGTKTGDGNEVKFPTVYLLDGKMDLQFEAETKANNAKYKLDGHEYESESNTISDVIPGLTLDLKQAAVGKPVRLQVTENREVISGKVKSFVDSYNAALSFIQNQHKLTNDAKGNPKLGPLGGDSMLRMTESRLRTTIQDAQDTDSKFKHVIELGIEFNRNGTLTLNEEKFNKTVNAEPDEVAKFLRGDFISKGFIPSLKKNIATIVDMSTGPVTTRKKSYQDRAAAIDKKIEQKERSLSKREEQIRAQFSRMEETMSKMKSQGQQFGGG